MDVQMLNIDFLGNHVCETTQEIYEYKQGKREPSSYYNNRKAESVKKITREFRITQVLVKLLKEYLFILT